MSRCGVSLFFSFLRVHILVFLSRLLLLYQSSLVQCLCLTKCQKCSSSSHFAYLCTCVHVFVLRQDSLINRSAKPGPKIAVAVASELPSRHEANARARVPNRLSFAHACYHKADWAVEEKVWALYRRTPGRVVGCGRSVSPVQSIKLCLS